MVRYTVCGLPWGKKMYPAIGTDARATLRVGWRTWTTGAAAGIALAALAPASALAESGAPAANEVVGYATADRSGAPTSWTLADGTPYLFVPYVDAEVAGSVAAVETGSDVGAVLFQRPYFESRDAGCAPELGSDARSDLRWRGATARFSPRIESESSAKFEQFASLIVYRQDIGPPPGVLLLNRRLTLGTSCLQAVHKTFFNRVFVPVAAPPEPARCYNLSGTYRQDNGKEITIDFAFADRLALLQPADLDDRYRSLRHRFRVILFDGQGCRGGGGEFRSEGKAPGNIRLDSIGLRDRVRSVRIVYEGGPLAPYYVVPTPAPVAEVPKGEVPEAEKEQAPQPAAPTALMANIAPEITAKNIAETSAEASAEITKDIVAPPPPNPPAQVPSDSVMAKATPAQTPAPVVAPVPASVPEKRHESAIARTQTTTIPRYAALPAPRLKLRPKKPVAPSPVASSTTFEYPVHDIYRLNFCLRWGVDCGEPAATAWCKAQGFAKAGAWRIDQDIGSLFPTIVLADKRVCAQFPCDGFEEITCVNEGPAPLPASKSATKG